MVCENCKVAGFINEEAIEAIEKQPEAVDAISDMARSWHGKCRDRGCVCQHVVGDVIDSYGVNPETRRTAHEKLSTKFRRFLRSA